MGGSGLGYTVRYLWQFCAVVSTVHGAGSLGLHHAGSHLGGSGGGDGV